MLRKEVALQNLESQLLISSPGTRNNDKIKQSHFYTTTIGDNSLFGGTRDVTKVNISYDYKS
jgi:hypothetical protein